MIADSCLGACTLKFWRLNFRQGFPDHRESALGMSRRLYFMGVLKQVFDHFDTNKAVWTENVTRLASSFGFKSMNPYRTISIPGHPRVHF